MERQALGWMSVSEYQREGEQRALSPRPPLAEDHDAIWVRVQAVGISVHPLHGGALVEQTRVTCAAVSATQLVVPEEAERVETVVRRNDNDRAIVRYQVLAVVEWAHC